MGRRVERSGVLAYMEKYIERITESGCWIWMGECNHPFAKGVSYGHGRIRLAALPETTVAHVAMYILLRGPVPDGMELDHQTVDVITERRRGVESTRGSVE